MGHLAVYATALLHMSVCVCTFNYAFVEAELSLGSQVSPEAAGTTV